MGQRALLYRMRKQRVVVDIFWLAWFVVGFALFLYLSTYIELDVMIAVKALIGFSMLIGGSMATYMLIGMEYDNNFTTREEGQFYSATAMSLVAIFMINMVTPPLSSLQPIPNSLFSVLIGIAEGCVFQGFFLSWILIMTDNNPLFAIGGSSLLATSFHAWVYGGSNSLLMIVFGSFCVLGWAYLFSGQRISVAQTPHALVNLLSFFSFGTLIFVEKEESN